MRRLRSGGGRGRREAGRRAGGHHAGGFVDDGEHAGKAGAAFLQGGIEGAEGADRAAGEQ